MSGDIANTSLWANADVYVAPIGTTLPATIDAAFPTGWTPVGLLDGKAGFETEAAWDKGDSFAWGGILMKTSRKNFKLTRKFVCFEDNDTVASLVWPGSTETELKVPHPEHILIAFETTEGTKKHRVISKNYAEVDVDGSMKEGEEDPTSYPLIATIYPDANGVLFTQQKTAAV